LKTIAMNSNETNAPDSIGQTLIEDDEQLKRRLDDLDNSEQLDQLVADLNEIPLADQFMGRVEFPMLADQLREAIDNSGKSISEIARGADIPQPMLWRFAIGERDIRLDTAAKLAEYFGMKLTKPRAKPKG